MSLALWKSDIHFALDGLNFFNITEIYFLCQGIKEFISDYHQYGFFLFLFDKFIEEIPQKL